MKISIEHIGKIQKADIEFNGITVIAGLNNSGKSTVGKTLYCIFNAFNKHEEKLLNEWKDGIEDRVEAFFSASKILSKSNPETEIAYNPFMSSLSRQIANDIIETLSHDFSKSTGNGEWEGLGKTVEEQLFAKIELDEETQDKILNSDEYAGLVLGVKEILQISWHDIQKAYINRFFQVEFSGQIQHVNFQEELSSISLSVKKHVIGVNIKHDKCVECSGELDLFADAIIVDNPLVINNISSIINNINSIRRNVFGSSRVSRILSHNNMLRRLMEADKNDVIVVNEIITANKLVDALDKLNSVFDGEIVTDGKGKIVYKNGVLAKPLRIENLSTGLKVFAIVKTLIENGSIKKEDVLILDEPEIHLHPEWQLVFAEILVLLQKEFDLSVLLTTHSPYFLEAIDVFSGIHGVKDRCKYYLAEADGVFATIKDVEGNLEPIYELLANPLQKLENLKYGGYSDE
ncbi:MAG: AAA family ATPase [Clostridiales bacterium]|nr:AAA family ATPase [Clostridiales bacterium]